MQVEEPVDAQQQVIGPDMLVEPELVEQLRRLGLDPLHRRVLPHLQKNGITATVIDQPPTKPT